MNPYDALPDDCFWSRQTAIDPAPKLSFDLARDRFMTAGSCFAQHFAREIRAAGGTYVQTEPGPFSARYGNIYTCRQLAELLAQAEDPAARRDMCAVRADGRFVDLARFNAVAEGFTTEADARADRTLHLDAMKRAIADATVFVFTLGLTETWQSTLTGLVFPMCPAAVGAYDRKTQRFVNFTLDECRADLLAACQTLRRINPAIKVLLTVSPVMLVATFESRGAAQSSTASKAILRAVADEAVRHFGYVDYFPSFEIITNPKAPPTYYAADRRDVSPDGVKAVMNTFFATRFGKTVSAQDLIDAECDEVLLGRQ